MKRTYTFLATAIAFTWLGAWLFHSYPESTMYAYSAWITATVWFIATGLSLIEVAARDD